MPSLHDHILVILKAFRQRKQKELRKENDRLVQQAVLTFTQPVFELAVLSYILSKIVSKPRFLHPEMEPQLRELERRLDGLLKANEEELLPSIRHVEKAIEELEGEDPRFMVNLLSKGRLKVAAIMYAQGVSLGLASEMTGVQKQDIMDYASKTMMFDRLKEEKSIHKRLKTARRLIG